MTNHHTRLYDVSARSTLGGEAVFQIRAPLLVIAKLFYLADDAVQRCKLELQTGGDCELFSNGKSRGAWGSLGGHAQPVYSIIVTKTDHIVLR
jgi:hypothetical protein